jgi:hypothetical protein
MKIMGFAEQFGLILNSITPRIGAKSILMRLPTMKLAIRIFALTVVFAGIAAAATTAPTSHLMPSHQSATSANPIPLCAPGLPGCPDVP